MSLSQMMAKISAAGFDGVDIVYGDYSQSELSGLLQQYRLACTVTAFPDSIEALTPALELAVALNARHLNIIGAVYPFSVEEGADFVLGLWQKPRDEKDIDVWAEGLRARAGALSKK